MNPAMKDSHHRAMELLDLATRARLEGRDQDAEVFTRQAYESERDAANRCAKSLSLEPTRSVLHRSAASLALDCKEFREAERLIGAALCGSPPEEIADELRDLLEEVHFARHLASRGIVLEPDELQLALAGQTVGQGIVSVNEFVGRAEAFEKLVYRTAERKMGIRFHEGRPTKDVRERFAVFVSRPKAGSFQVSFRIGRPDAQMVFPGFEQVRPSDIVDDIIKGLDDLNRGNEPDLHAQIPEEAYYRNFVGLARKIAPDGRAVRLVGLTLTRQNTVREIALTKVRRQIPISPIPVAEERARVTGTLRFADATGGQTGKIKIVDESGDEHLVLVPEGMMNDIVRPLWDASVIVEGVRRRSGIEMEDIKPAEE